MKVIVDEIERNEKIIFYRFRLSNQRLTIVNVSHRVSTNNTKNFGSGFALNACFSSLVFLDYKSVYTFILSEQIHLRDWNGIQRMTPNFQPKISEKIHLSVNEMCTAWNVADKMCWYGNCWALRLFDNIPEAINWLELSGFLFRCNRQCHFGNLWMMPPEVSTLICFTLLLFFSLF